MDRPRIVSLTVYRNEISQNAFFPLGCTRRIQGTGLLTCGKCSFVWFKAGVVHLRVFEVSD